MAEVSEEADSMAEVSEGVASTEEAAGVSEVRRRLFDRTSGVSKNF
jgi:hypothetical protein